VLILIACLYAYTLFAFWEPSNVERGSLIYQLKIPTIAKNYPTWDELGVPLYDFRIADGVKPRVVNIHYTSAMYFPSLILLINKLNFDCGKPEGKYAVCKKDSSHGAQYDISLKETDAGTEVEVSIIGDEQ
jgi:hypothetical protein